MISEISSRRRGWQTVGAFGDIGLFSAPTKDLRPRSSTVDCFLLSWSWSDHEGNQRPMTRVRANSQPNTIIAKTEANMMTKNGKQKDKDAEKDKNQDKFGPNQEESQRPLTSGGANNPTHQHDPHHLQTVTTQLCQLRWKFSPQNGWFLKKGLFCCNLLRPTKC